MRAKLDAFGVDGDTGSGHPEPREGGARKARSGADEVA